MRSVFVYQLQITNANKIKSDFLINPRATARSAVPGVSPGRGTNSPRLFTQPFRYF